MIQTQEEKQRLLEGADMDIVRVAHIAGSIEAADQEKLKKLIFRATRGKALTYIEELNYDH
jgi:succinate dehydrogenase flavin-adding protein (antitoxin of CptAB toxin-antitoxin module)